MSPPFPTTSTTPQSSATLSIPHTSMSPLWAASSQVATSTQTPITNQQESKGLAIGVGSGLGIPLVLAIIAGSYYIFQLRRKLKQNAPQLSPVTKYGNETACFGLRRECRRELTLQPTVELPWGKEWRSYVFHVLECGFPGLLSSVIRPCFRVPGTSHATSVTWHPPRIHGKNIYDKYVTSFRTLVYLPPSPTLSSYFSLYITMHLILQ